MMTPYPFFDFHLPLAEQAWTAQLPTLEDIALDDRMRKRRHPRQTLVRISVARVQSPALGQTTRIRGAETEAKPKLESTPRRIMTILHPTDFLGHSVYAFKLACSLAQEHGARVLALHVAPAQSPAATACNFSVLGLLAPDDYRAHLASRLRQLQTQYPQVRVEPRLEEGDVVTAILRVAREASADLIVMGTRGQTGRTRFPMGSVAGHVVQKATCPVVTIEAARVDSKRGASGNSLGPGKPGPFPEGGR
jgi:nucleotide-binding universal stress UspA family protein